MTKKQLLEFILLTLFLASALCAFFRIPYIGLITVISGFFLGMLYFYGAFWLFAETNTPIVIRIISGVAFSITIIAFNFCLQHWPYWQMYGVVSYALLGVMTIICLVNFKSLSYKPLLFRCFLFVILLSLIFSYRKFSA